jgi:hypothetical protein
MLDDHETSLATHLLIECAVLIRIKDDVSQRQHGISAEATKDIVGALFSSPLSTPLGVIIHNKMSQLTPDEEEQVCEALSNIGGLETEHGLHGESVRAIRGLLQCSPDDAIAILRDMRVRKLIDLENTPAGQSDARKPMPVMQLRWIRPTTHR